jgi:hypothetical protein
MLWARGHRRKGKTWTKYLRGAVRGPSADRCAPATDVRRLNISLLELEFHGAKGVQIQGSNALGDGADICNDAIRAICTIVDTQVGILSMTINGAGECGTAECRGNPASRNGGRGLRFGAR